MSGTRTLTLDASESFIPDSSDSLHTGNGHSVTTFHIEGIPERLSAFLGSRLHFDEIEKITLVRSRNLNDIAEMEIDSGILNLTRFNNCLRINKYFEAVNDKLAFGQFYITCFESMATRKAKLFSRYGKWIGWPLYYLDFILNRVFSKLSWTRAAYFKITSGKNRVLSLTEGLGRLVSCGFEIIDFKTIDGRTYVVTKKVSEPTYDMEPTYGALVKLRRIGKDGKLFNVYKFRTMYPYSEYVQDFVFKNNDLQEGGKLRDDFRVTSWGRLFRRYWIDEIPMLINLFKGEMKLVGVRPLSEHYYNLYPSDMQMLRTMVKPGLIPPFYVDLPKTLDEIIESERNYLKKYMDAPIRTDISYFIRAWFNILIRKARSK